MERGEGRGELIREKVRGTKVHKACRKYQHDWLYLKSITLLNTRNDNIKGLMSLKLISLWFLYFRIYDHGAHRGQLRPPRSDQMVPGERELPYSSICISLLEQHLLRLRSYMSQKLQLGTVLRIRNVHPGSWFWFIPDPTIVTKEEREKLVVLPFL